MRNYTILLLSIFSIYFLMNTSMSALHMIDAPITSANIVVTDANDVALNIPRGTFKALDDLFDVSGKKPISLKLSRSDLERLISYQHQENITECSLDFLSNDIHWAEFLDAPRVTKRNLLRSYFAVTKFMAQKSKSESILEALPARARIDYKQFKTLWPRYFNSIANLLSEDPALFIDCVHKDTLQLNYRELDTLEGLTELFDYLAESLTSSDSAFSSTSIKTLDVRYNNLTKLSVGTLQHQCPSLTTIKAQYNEITSLDRTDVNLKRNLQLSLEDNPLSNKQIESFKRMQPSFLLKMTPYLNRITLATSQEKCIAGIFAIVNMIFLKLLHNICQSNVETRRLEVALITIACICSDIFFLAISNYHYQKNVDPHLEEYKPYKKIQLITDKDNKKIAQHQTKKAN